MKKKTDNKDLSQKIALRSDVIKQSGFSRVAVLDVCAGTGRIWKAMRRELEVYDYVACDREPKFQGCLKAEALAALAFHDLARFDVIDVDTYGSPWPEWEYISARIARRTVVLLTHGGVGLPWYTLRMEDREILGIPPGWNIPVKASLARSLAERAIRVGLNNDLRLVYGAKIVFRNVVYYGFVVEPERATPSAGTRAQ